jgi:hypothetical protein
MGIALSRTPIPTLALPLKGRELNQGASRGGTNYNAAASLLGRLSLNKLQLTGRGSGCKLPPFRLAIALFGS